MRDLALDAGVSLKVVSERLGHSQIAITADLYKSPTTAASAQVRSPTTVLGEQSRRGDSNPQPPVYKTGALPIAPRRRTAADETYQRRAGLRNPTCPTPAPGAPR